LLVLALSVHIFSAPQAANPPGVFRIAGILIGANGGAPLNRGKVSLVEVKRPQEQISVITGDDGRFEFPRVAPGKYSLRGAKHGYISAAYDEHEQYSSAIVTGAGLDTEHLMLKLFPSAMIAGKVLDETGDPARHTGVTLYREDHQAGMTRILTRGNDTTDDRGYYEFANLAPGTYFVSATDTPWYAIHPVGSANENGTVSGMVDPSLDVAYPTVYYQDATEPDDALPIPVRGGDSVEVTLHMTPVPSLRLRFRTPDTAQGFTAPMLERPALGGMESIPGQGAEQIAPGLWEMAGVPAGRYSVRIQPQYAGSSQRNVEMNITSDGEELDTAQGQADGSVKASVTMTNKNSLPTSLQLGLLDSKLRMHSTQNVNAKGEAEFQNVMPGKYQILAHSEGKAYSVTSVLVQGHRVSQNSLDVTSGSSLDVALTVAAGSTNVEGFAKRDGKPSAGAMVVLVPEHPEYKVDLFRRDQSDLDGSFVLLDVVPGRYTILAIENGWELDWSSPGVIGYYVKHGQAVVVPDQAKTSMSLPNAVEVQSK
jgi:protocatechuate 3,4-dioxygenase beta subunit